MHDLSNKSLNKDLKVLDYYSSKMFIYVVYYDRIILKCVWVHYLDLAIENQ